MVLDFNKGLFERPGLFNDDGTLKRRWGQEGSVLINARDGQAEDEIIHTVTTGKTYYVTDLTVTLTENEGAFITLRDGGATGTIKFKLTVAPANHFLVPITIHFDSPLFFTTDVYVQTSEEWEVNTSGWEE